LQELSFFESPCEQKTVTLPGVTDAFFVAEGAGRFAPTEWTRGPWGPDAQHGGPPAALLGHVIEKNDLAADMPVARITFDLLQPVPLKPLHARVRLVRSGKRVRLVESALLSDGTEVMRANAWLIRSTQLDVPQHRQRATLKGPDAGVPMPTFDPENRSGYLNGMEWCFVDGAFMEPGPATAWLRMRHPLVAGEVASPLTRVLIAADSASGISAELDFRHWLFINPDLSIYLHRMPVGEWVCLDATTTPESSGVGVAASIISDERGTIGRSVQSLYIAPRE
jgi:hypothetical protein